MPRPVQGGAKFGVNALKLSFVIVHGVAPGAGKKPERMLTKDYTFDVLREFGISQSILGVLR